MDLLMKFLVVFFATAAVLAFVFGRRTRRQLLRVEKRLVDETVASRRRLADLTAAATEGASLAEQSGLELGRADQELKLQLDRAARLFAAVEQMEKQRDEWKRMYQDAVAGHATAQEMLLSELNRVSRVAKLEVKPHLRDLVGGYREKFSPDAVPPSQKTD